MNRHGLTLSKKTTTCLEVPHELIPKLESYIMLIRRMRTKHHYPLSGIGAMDETACWVDMVGDTTIEQKGAKSISIRATGNQKNRFTVVLAAKASGTTLHSFHG